MLPLFADEETKAKRGLLARPASWRRWKEELGNPSPGMND